MIKQKILNKYGNSVVADGWCGQSRMAFRIFGKPPFRYVEFEMVSFDFSLTADSVDDMFNMDIDGVSYACQIHSMEFVSEWPEKGCSLESSGVKKAAKYKGEVTCHALSQHF